VSCAFHIQRLLFLLSAIISHSFSLSLASEKSLEANTRVASKMRRQSLVLNALFFNEPSHEH
jgi:hypothetical protein